jgi:hypothetical protein
VTLPPQNGTYFLNGPSIEKRRGTSLQCVHYRDFFLFRAQVSYFNHLKIFYAQYLSTNVFPSKVERKKIPQILRKISCLLNFATFVYQLVCFIQSLAQLPFISMCCAFEKLTLYTSNKVCSAKHIAICLPKHQTTNSVYLSKSKRLRIKFWGKVWRHFKLI